VRLKELTVPRICDDAHHGKCILIPAGIAEDPLSNGVVSWPEGTRKHLINNNDRVRVGSVVRFGDASSRANRDTQRLEVSRKYRVDRDRWIRAELFVTLAIRPKRHLEALQRRA
jgi:hypothetical protein